MSKIAFIIPGFGCPTKNKEYQEIAKYFKKKQYKPVLIEIDWKRNTHTRYVEQFNEQYYQHVKKNDEVCILGFSFGAMTSFIASAELNPTLQILCSISPYFKEDMPHIRNWWKTFFGKKRCEVFENLSFDQVAKRTKCKTILIAGDSEGIELARRVKDAKKKIKNSELFILEGVKHNIADDRYLKKIKEVIENV